MSLLKKQKLISKNNLKSRFDIISLMYPIALIIYGISHNWSNGWYLIGIVSFVYSCNHSQHYFRLFNIKEFDLKLHSAINFIIIISLTILTLVIIGITTNSERNDYIDLSQILIGFTTSCFMKTGTFSHILNGSTRIIKIILMIITLMTISIIYHYILKTTSYIFIIDYILFLLFIMLKLAVLYFISEFYYKKESIAYE